MLVIRNAGALALLTLLVGACESTPPQRQSSPLIPQSQGTTEEQLRQVQLRNAQQNPGMQNPVATGTGVGGIVRDPATSGSGNITAGAPVAVNPGTTGIVRQPGVGAPTR